MKRYLARPVLSLIILALSGISIAGDVHLHPMKAYLIKYVLEGMQTGEIIQQCRNWCNEMVETSRTTMSMGGMKQSTHTRTVSIRDKIYNIDPDTGKLLSVINNPMYPSLVKSLKKGGDSKKIMHEWMDAMGYKATGNTRTIAKETCKDYTSPQLMGSTNCITDDALTLYTEVRMGGMPPMVRRAVKVRRNYAGKNEDYAVPKGSPDRGSATQGVQPGMPKNIQELLKNYQGGRGK